MRNHHILDLCSLIDFQHYLAQMQIVVYLPLSLGPLLFSIKFIL